MIESQQREMRCVLLVSVQTAATTNKQLRSSQEPNMLRKTHACTVCLWLTDEMFNISIRSWFPLWLPPARLMFRSDSFFIILFILCPTLWFFFSEVYFLCILPVTSPRLWICGWSVLFLMPCIWYPFTSAAMVFGSMGFGMPGSRVFVLILLQRAARLCTGL